MPATKENTPIPVNILTGFLGSGKTTLLRKILANEAFGDTAVLINEFGEVGLDQVLVEEIAEDVVLLNSGCLCCTLRGELRDALEDLLNKREAGTIPSFKRIIVETTGLAKPALILSTVFADPRIRHHYTIGTIVTTVDCLHSKTNAENPPEWLEQIAAADTLVLTKQQLVEEKDVDAIAHYLKTLNATAELHSQQDINLPTLFEITYDKAKTASARQVAGQFSKLIANGKQGTEQLKPLFAHENNADTLHLTHTGAIDWEAFGVWLSMLLHAHGDKILRVKGMLHIEGNDAPVVIQGVQHVIYPPEHLESWKDLPLQTSLIFIVRDLDPQKIQKSFNTFVLKEPIKIREISHA